MCPEPMWTFIIKYLNTHKHEINYRRNNLVSPDNHTRSHALFHYFKPYTFFFSKDICFIFLVAAAEDYTTKSIRRSLTRVRILHSYVTMSLQTYLKKKTKILVLYYSSTWQCGAHAVLSCYTYTHILHVPILL